MGDALAEVEKRLLSNSDSSCGASWLCPDELGSGFTFLEDREAGRRKLIKMVNQQVTYFQFLMSNLPVETKLPIIQGLYPPPLSEQDLGCVPSTDPVAYAKHEEAAKFFFLGVRQVHNWKYTDVDGKDITFPPQLKYPVAAEFEKKTKDWSAESVVDSMIKYPLTVAQIAQRQVFFNEEFKDDKTIKAADKRTNPRWLCFPMGNDVPLRQYPLKLDEIKAVQYYMREVRSGRFDPTASDYKEDPTGINYDPQSGAYTWKDKEGGTLGVQKVSLYRSNYFPVYEGRQGIFDTSKLPDCVKYKMIADYPYDVFGWKTGADGKPTINLAMNDLFNEYLKYLGNPNMSFEPFRNNMAPPVVGLSGNPIPIRCLYGSCEEWDREGFANYEQWIKSIMANRSENLEPGDVELVGGIDMNSEFKMFYEKAYVNYAKNPEFMPAYQQVIRWEFSDACADDINYMFFNIVVDKNKFESYFFTQDSYNYAISVKVKARYEKFVKELLDATWAYEYQVYNYDKKFGGGIWEEKDASRDFSYILQNGEEVYKKIAASFGTYPTDISVVDKAIYNAKFDKLKATVKTNFLVPEDTDKEVNIKLGTIIEFIISIAAIYRAALTNISKFDKTAEYNKQYYGARDCLKKQKANYEGVPMTDQQNADYRTNLVKIFYNNWEEIAKAEYETYEKNFHDAFDNAEWIRTHPILNYFRESVFLRQFITPIMDLAVAGSMISDTGIMIFAGLFVSNPISLFIMGLTLTMINTTWETMAPPGSLYHHEPPLEDSKILEQYGIQLGLAVSGEIGSRIVAGLVPILFNISAAVLSSALAKIQRGLGIVCEDSEELLKRIANNKAAFSRLLQNEADSGFSKAFQEFTTLRNEVEGVFRLDNVEMAEALAFKKQLQESIAQRIEAMEARGGYHIDYNEFNTLINEQKEAARRIKGITDEIAAADKAVDYQRVAVLRNQLEIETSRAANLADQLDIAVNDFNAGGRKTLVDNENIAYKKMKQLEEDLKAARDANNIDVANDLQLQLEQATKSWEESNAALVSSFRNEANVGDIAEDVKMIADSQKALADLERKTNDDFFKYTDAYQKKISELGLILEEAAKGTTASSQIARLASDIERSKGTLELAKLYYNKAEQALIATNPEEIGVFASALENYERTAKNYWDAVENQFFYSNMSALALSFVSRWPDPLRLANAGALVTKIFVEAFTSEVGGYFQSWVDRSVLDTASAFGLEAVAQTSNSIITVISHHYCNTEYKLLEPPKFGEEYPVLNPNTESPAMNIEMYRLRHDYIEPLLETYIFLNALLKELEDLDNSTKGKDAQGRDIGGWHWMKYFKAWNEKYQTEAEFKAKYPNVKYTLANFIANHEAHSFHVSEQEFIEKTGKIEMEKYVIPYDMMWQAREERTQAYIKFSYLLMDKYSGNQWTNEELSRFPQSSLPEYIVIPPK